MAVMGRKLIVITARGCDIVGSGAASSTTKVPIERVEAPETRLITVLESVIAEPRVKV